MKSTESEHIILDIYSYMEWLPSCAQKNLKKHGIKRLHPDNLVKVAQNIPCKNVSGRLNRLSQNGSS